MLGKFKNIILIIVLVVSPTISYADHVFGGSISMIQIDKSQGKFKFTLGLYVDDVRLPAGDDAYFRANPIPIKTFRKRDNVEVEKIMVKFEKTRSIVYDNQACATLRSFKTTEYVFTATTDLDLSKYSDADGYYTSFAICCRNVDVDNIVLPGESGMAFYTEFPALTENGNPTDYSTPEFPALNGDYICSNKNFKFDFSATDKDGDILKYSLVKPYRGFNSLPGKGPGPAAEAVAGPYPEIDWISGYSANNAIKGSPALAIDGNTGLLTIKATEQGLFLFSVACEEFRNGKRIGVTRHDFQLAVVDCPKQTPPFPLVTYQGNPANEIEICKGNAITLETTNNAAWNFQWQKDLDNVVGAKLNTLTVTEAGLYTVTKSFKTTCSSDTISQTIKVKNSAVMPPKILSKRTDTCIGDTIKLSAQNITGVTYKWYVDKVFVSSGNTLITEKTGIYTLEATAATTSLCPIQKDSLKLNFTYKVTVAPPSLSVYNVCRGDSVKITTPSITNNKYQWYYKNTQVVGAVKNELWAKNAGDYTVKLKDISGCEGVSSPYNIVLQAAPTVRIDSVLPRCFDKGIANLIATPTGGTFTGKGIVGNSFNPTISGTGRYKVEYRLSQSSGCGAYGETFIEIYDSPKITLPKSVTINPNESVTLNLQTTQTNLSFLWTPNTFLNNAAVQKPVSTPTQNIVYKVFIKNQNGCETRDSISVNLLFKVLIPAAFTPNGDLQNNTWQLFGIDRYPEAEILIYNRWGEPVFYSKGYNQPFDGTQDGKPLPEGAYAYTITLDNTKRPLNGTITILR